MVTLKGIWKLKSQAEGHVRLFQQTGYLRRHSDRLQIGRRRVLSGDHLGVNVAVQLVVDGVVAHVLQRCSARGALEALNVQIFLFYPHENSPVILIKCSVKFNSIRLSIHVKIFIQFRKESSEMLISM